MLEKIKKQLDSIFMALFGVFVIAVIPSQISESMFSSMGPRFFPYLLALTIVLLSVGSIIKGLFFTEPEENKSENVPSAKSKPNYLFVALTFTFLLLWVFFVPVLGFVVTTILFTAIMMLTIGSRSILQITTVSLAFPGIVYYLFGIVLKVVLPEGIFL